MELHIPVIVHSARTVTSSEVLAGHDDSSPSTGMPVLWRYASHIQWLSVGVLDAVICEVYIVVGNFDADGTCSFHCRRDALDMCRVDECRNGDNDGIEATAKAIFIEKKSCSRDNYSCHTVQRATGGMNLCDMFDRGKCIVQMSL